MVLRIEEFIIYRISTADNKRSAPKKFFCSDKKALHLPSDMSMVHIEYTDYFFTEGLEYPGKSRTSVSGWNNIYHQVPKFPDARKLGCNQPKIYTKRPNPSFGNIASKDCKRQHLFMRDNGRCNISPTFACRREAFSS